MIPSSSSKPTDCGSIVSVYVNNGDEDHFNRFYRDVSWEIRDDTGNVLISKNLLHKSETTETCLQEVKHVFNVHGVNGNGFQTYDDFTFPDDTMWPRDSMNEGVD